MAETANGVDLSSSQQSVTNGEGMVYVLKSNSNQWVSLSDENQDLDEKLFEESLTYFIDPVLILNSDSSSSSLIKDSNLPSIASTLKSQLGSTTSSASSISSPSLLEGENQSAVSLGIITQDSNSPSRKSNFLNLSSFSFLSSVLQESNSSSVKSKSKKGKDNVGEEKQSQDFKLLPLLPDSHSQRSGATEELRSIRWAAYAIRALVVRFWALIKVSLS